MPKSPQERKEIAHRHADKQRYRDDINRREQAIHDRVQALIDAAIARSKTARGYDLPAILLGLEEARCLAMAIQKPDAAVNALYTMAKVQGLIVDQTAVGRPEEFPTLHGDIGTLRQGFADQLAEKFGSVSKARRMIEFMKRLREEPDDVVEAEASEVKDERDGN